MLTLDELKEAVAGWNSLVKSESVINKCKVAEFARDYIAREAVLDTPLTSEVCERLGMHMAHTTRNYIFCSFNPVEEPGTVTPLFFRDDGKCVMYGYKGTPTIRHLLAAATLAGVTVDLSRLDQPAIDI